MAAVVFFVSTAVAWLTVFLGLGLWLSLDVGHDGMSGLVLVFAVLYALGVVLGSAAGFVVIRMGAATSSPRRLRGLAILAVVGAVVGSAGYFFGWISGLFPVLG